MLLWCVKSTSNFPIIFHIISQIIEIKHFDIFLHLAFVIAEKLIEKLEVSNMHVRNVFLMFMGLNCNY